jgi:LmbE family N-acetylglucosaminyl deacetylase/CheY-like chemotaxis protein
VDAEQQDPHRPAGRARGRVLIVEDDPGTRSFLAAALTRAAFDVTAVGSAPPAIELLEGDSWHVLLVDIGLPGMSGFDLVRHARRRFPSMATALMTADARVDVAVQALRSEVDDFLPKPIAPKTLIAQVERLVQRQQARSHQSTERVLAVGAHPDDVEIGVGGILLRHRAAGDEVAVVTLSRGSIGGDQVVRADEAAKAAAALSARLHLENLEDTKIPEGNPTIQLIEAVIGEFRPTIVYTHSIHDQHQDHRNVHLATMVAARRVPSIYCYESPSATVDFRPARFVAIDGYIDGKVEVIDAYRSQVEIRRYLAEDLVRAAARYWGGRFGTGNYGEPLEVIRDRPGAVPSSLAVPNLLEDIQV